jgi:tetratricopeptide (TPR) repeat protein
MASSFHSGRDASSGSATNEGDALEKILGRLNINDGVPPSAIDEMTLYLEQRLNLNINSDLIRTMAVQVIEDRLKNMRLSRATITATAAASASAPSRHQSPRRAASTRHVPGSFPQPPMRPPSPKPGSPLPRAFIATRSQNNRGRSPSRSNGTRIKQQSRSRTPNKINPFARTKPPISPETTGNSGTFSVRQRSRSPHAGRSQSPLQRLFGASGTTRYEKCPNEATSPSVYHEAHSTEESLLEGRTPPVSERGSQRTLTPNGRPPLSSVNIDPAGTGNVMIPPAQAYHKGETGSSFSGPPTPQGKIPTQPTAFSPQEPAGGGSSPSNFHFDPNGDRFHIGSSPAKTKKGSPNRIKSPAGHHSRGLRASPRKLNVAVTHTRPLAPPASVTQPMTPQRDNFPMTPEDLADMFSPPTPLESDVKQDRSFTSSNRPPAPAGAYAAPTQIGAEINIGGANANSNVRIPFISPITPFPPPVSLVGETGPAGRHTHDEDRNRAEPVMVGRRQTAPAQMAFAAAHVFASVKPESPDMLRDSTVPNLQPPRFVSGIAQEPFQTNATTRQAEIPPVGNTDPAIFNVDLGANKPFSKTKVKFKRGSNFRKGVGGRSFSTNNIATGLGSIPQISTDDTLPTSGSEESGESNVSFQHASTLDQFSPSNASSGSEAMSIDSPHPSQNTTAQKASPGGKQPAAPCNDGRFNIGVGDATDSTAAPGARKAGKRREISVRRKYPQHSQSNSGFAPIESQSHPPSFVDSTSSCPPVGGTNSVGSFGVMGTNPVMSEKLEKLTKLREQGKASYNKKAFQQSIVSNTEGIRLFLEGSGQNPSRDFLAILYSNRAAALMMVGAFEAVVNDCRKALEIVSDPATMEVSANATPLLKTRLHERIARAHLRLGLVEEADKEFGNAIGLCTILESSIATEQDTECRSKLYHITTQSTLGLSEVNRLREILAKIAQFNEHNAQRVLERQRISTIDALSDVTMALSIATGCNDLHRMKVNLLADLKRFREVIYHSERLAAATVLFDGCFVGDLAPKSPIAAPTAAKYLRSDFFDNAKEDSIDEFERMLSSKAAGEAVLRLPHNMIPLYMRSLRLEERNSVAEVCLQTLEQFVSDSVGRTGREGLNGLSSWLPIEKARLFRTMAGRSLGDEFYGDGEYEKALEQYAACLLVDFEGNQFAHGAGEGGKLHAILHCNRAACFMALKKNSEALIECTAALRIHSGYMKAKWRRARCYSRLKRFEEAVEEYKGWLEMVRQAKIDPNSFSSIIRPCIFEGPHTINEKDVDVVKQELDELLKVRAQAQRTHAAYEQVREQCQHDIFNKDSSYSARNTDAQRRREYFHSYQSSSRRWDSFADQRPNSSRSGKARSKAEEIKVNSSRSERPIKSPREYADSDSHYDVLQITINATVSEIKKAYRTMARAYHPDKNSDPSAVESFQRIQLAHDVLTIPESRRKHDSDLRFRRR